MQFNEKLKELRSKKGVSQSELAEKIFVSRSAVAKWENGLGLPNAESLRLLSEYFGVSADELCTDEPTEKVIVQKNQIISRSRRLLMIISTVLAVAFTVIIVLAVVLGLSVNAAPADDDEIVNVKVTMRGSVYDGGGYDYENKNWALPFQLWKTVSGKGEQAPPGEVPQELYNLVVGEEYVLSLQPSPSGYNGHAFGLRPESITIKFDEDIFEIFLGDPEMRAGGRADYVFKVKEPCSLELIMVYFGNEITKDTKPEYIFIINAVLPTWEDA